jgi:3-oxoacyl-(acyl-carrier-protein) synthase
MKIANIFIRSIGLLTAAGNTKGFYPALAHDKHFFVKRDFTWGTDWVAALDERSEATITRLRDEKALYREFDRSTLMAIAAAREAWNDAGWGNDGVAAGVLVGSSRGATETFERRHADFLSHPDRRTEVLTSPTTTLGNLSSSIAQDLLLQGPEVSFSITCSSTLHSLVAALGWIRSQMCTRMLIGGAEAALSEFSVAQMKALRIYTASTDVSYPSRPLSADTDKCNTFALGEAAAIFAIDGLPSLGSRSALAEIAGIGWAIEPISTMTSMSTPGSAFSQAMEMALEGLEVGEKLDAIVAHAPGTIIGDSSELAAIDRIFPNQRPRLYSPKWQFGHTFGASGGLNLAVAVHLLNGGKVFIPKFQIDHEHADQSNVRSVLVNGAGFGGNACSVLLRRAMRDDCSVVKY